MAWDAGEVETQTPIRLRYNGSLVDMTTAYDEQALVHAEPIEAKNHMLNTTVGRVILHDNMPQGMPFINGLLKKKGLGQLVSYTYLRYGPEMTVTMLDHIKELGFLYATRAGITISIDDLIVPPGKRDFVDNAQNEVVKVDQQYRDGAITNGERYNKVIAIWSDVTEKISDMMFTEMERAEKASHGFNPILLMADSGARGSKQQIRQLAGMRNHRKLPRRSERVAVLYFDTRRTQRPGGYRLENRGFRLPHPAARRCGARRHHQSGRLRNGRWNLRWVDC
jgi:DNA-directed RNA polymerase subunit beta'